MLERKLLPSVFHDQQILQKISNDECVDRFKVDRIFRTDPNPTKPIKKLNVG
jgi:hypothetical protein